MPNTNINKRIRKTIKYTATLTLEEVEAALREYVGAPTYASVDFDCGYDGYFKEAAVTWTETETEDDADG